MKRRGADWAAAGMLALLAWLVILPLTFVLIEALRDGHGWSAVGIRQFLAEPREWRALWSSLWLSVASVVGSAVIGVPLALLTARVRFPGSRIVVALLSIPAVLPPLVGVLAFLFLYGETGFAARLVQAVTGLEEAPWRLQGSAAVLLVHVSTMYVYFFLFARAGLARLDGSVYEAAASLGAGRWRTFRRVVVPLLRSSLVGASLLVFMTSLASFSAPYLFGGNFRVMPTQIFTTKLNGDDRLAMVETLSLTLLALGALGLLRRAERKTTVPMVGKGVAPAPAPSRSRLAQIGLTVAGWAAALWLAAPALTLVVVSLVPRGTWTIEPIPPVYSLHNYVTLLRDPLRLGPILNSGWMATVATLGAIGLALGGSWLAVRHRVRLGGWLTGIMTLPWAVPATVFAIALATAFSVNSPWVGRVVLIGTPAILPIAYLVRNLPITGRAILAGVRQLDPSLEEAAQTMGVGRWGVFRRVTLPLLRPAIVAGGCLAFVTAFGDFVTSILLYTYDTRPISLEILASLRQSDVGVAAAYGVMLMTIGGLVFYLAGARSDSA
ncbi:MAG: iron ABC transporter permease [Gemmatimonadota bacterium]